MGGMNSSTNVDKVFKDDDDDDDDDDHDDDHVVVVVVTMSMILYYLSSSCVYHIQRVLERGAHQHPIPKVADERCGLNDKY